MNMKKELNEQARPNEVGGRTQYDLTENRGRKVKVNLRYTYLLGSLLQHGVCVGFYRVCGQPLGSAGSCAAGVGWGEARG